MVGVAEDWCEDCEGGNVVEDRAEGDSRGFDGWEIYGGLLVRLERSGQSR